MDFKITKDRVLCIDLTESSKEEIVLVINTILSVNDLLKQAGHKIEVKVKKKPDYAVN